jgi:hypothetical protein
MQINKDIKEYKLKSTSDCTMDISPILLRETSTTRLLFNPRWVSEDKSSNPLRGGFVFQRKSPKNEWSNFESKSLSSLKKDEEYRLNLEGREIAKLLAELSSIDTMCREIGHNYGEHSVYITDKNIEGIFVQIANPERKDSVVNALKNLEKNNFENLDSIVSTVKLDSAIKTIENNMWNSDEGFWQEFFQNNNTVLQSVFAFPVIYLNGETYLGGKRSTTRNGSGGVVSDFLMKNLANSSFAVIEIKTPTSKLVGGKYRGDRKEGNENLVFSMSQDLTGGMVQLENEINTALTYFQFQIKRDYEVNNLNPCGILIVGDKSTLSPDEVKSFNLFRKNIGGNQIYTYDELLEKLKFIKKII